MGISKKFTSIHVTKNSVTIKELIKIYLEFKFNLYHIENQLSSQRISTIKSCLSILCKESLMKKTVFYFFQYFKILFMFYVKFTTSSGNSVVNFT